MRRQPRRRRPLVLTVLGGLVLIALGGASRGWRLLEAGKPRPDRANVRYGPSGRNVLDLWLAPGGADGERGAKRPAPLVVFFHGGGFLGGDKSSVPAWLVTRCLAAGISVASANYRLSREAPFPAPMRDGARAVQFLRLKAAEYGIDPGRIAACGNSAGGGIALWVGFHDDLADPAGADPVLRQSSRLACMGVVGAQTSYDPRFIRDRIGGRAHEHVAIRPLFGIRTVADERSPRVERLFEEASPLNLVSRDDPPVLLFYSEPDGPLPPDAPPGRGIHHPRFGAALREKLDPLGIECLLRHHDDYRGREDPEAAMYGDLVGFFAARLKRP